MDNPKIIKLDSQNKDHMNAISFLHKQLLPESKISMLGDFFLKKFYYKTLIEKNLIDAFLYKFDDKFVGFIVATNYPFTFMKKGIDRSFLYISYILTISIILQILSA
jgi:hypothetical protein